MQGGGKFDNTAHPSREADLIKSLLSEAIPGKIARDAQKNKSPNNPFYGRASTRVVRTSARKPRMLIIFGPRLFAAKFPLGNDSRLNGFPSTYEELIAGAVPVLLIADIISLIG